MITQEKLSGSRERRFQTVTPKSSEARDIYVQLRSQGLFIPDVGVTVRTGIWGRENKGRLPSSFSCLENIKVTICLIG